MNYVTYAIPFQQMRNRQVLSDKQLNEEPHLREFIEHFPRCFEYDHHNAVWLYYPDGDAPKS